MKTHEILSNQLIVFSFWWLINYKNLIARRLKKVSTIKETTWFYEIGEAPATSAGEELLRAANVNVLFSNYHKI